MPSPHELIGILVAIFVIWFVLKLAKVAIKFIILLIALLAVAWLVYALFMR